MIAVTMDPARATVADAELRTMKNLVDPKPASEPKPTNLMGRDAQNNAMLTIIQAVAGEFRMDARSLRRGRSHSPKMVRPRHLAMLLIRDTVMPQPSHPQIGRFFAKHHTTVLHAIQKMRLALERDPKLEAIAHRVKNGTAALPVDYFDRRVSRLKAEIAKVTAEWVERLNYIEERERARRAEDGEGGMK